MFYDHKILTSKKHGVATIWLVATLGSGSSLKKITRKAILDVKISDACQTIITPDVPMALRLQGGLLYGVSRVFSQQCGYILADAENLRSKMRGVAVMMRDSQTDHTIGTTKADQLNLREDPDFNIDFDFSLDMVAFGLDHASSGSSMLSPHSLDSSQSSLLVDEVDGPEFGLPSAITGADFNYPDFGLENSTNSVVKSANYYPLPGMIDEPAIFDTSDIQVNGEGDIMIFGDDEASVQAGPDGAAPSISGFTNDKAVARLGLDDQQTDVVNQGMEALDLNFDDDIMSNMDHRRATPPMPASSPYPAQEQQCRPSSLSGDNDEAIEVTTEAPQRRVKRAVPPLEFDFVAELSNGHLAAWSTNYIENMEASEEERAGRKALALAKRNAEFWVLDQGLGGVQINLGSDTKPHPFSVFSGQHLLNALTGTEATAGKKRSHSASSHESGDEDRRVRSRSERQQIGRGDVNHPVIEDEEGAFPQDDYPESEVGRRAGSSLKDQSSQMPWNLSSRQGSARPYGSGLRGISSSVGGHVDAELGPYSGPAYRQRRMTSASPLIGRGRQLSYPASVDLRDETILTNFDIDEFGDIEDQLAGSLDDNFQLYAPATGVSTQTTAQGQWMAAALEKEAHNFLEFLRTSIHEKLLDRDTDSDDQELLTTTFSTLLPPKTNSKAVGAQGLLHVLALVTKGLVNVAQVEAFGDIQLSVIESAPYPTAIQGADVVETEA